MDEPASDVLTLVGLAFTVLGAGVTARAVVLRPEDAVRIGLARYASDDYQQNLRLPMVQNLLASSRWAKRGLWAVAFGTVLQMLPPALRLMG